MRDILTVFLVNILVFYNLLYEDSMKVNPTSYKLIVNMYTTLLFVSGYLINM